MLEKSHGHARETSDHQTRHTQTVMTTEMTEEKPINISPSPPASELVSDQPETKAKDVWHQSSAEHIKGFRDLQNPDTLLAESDRAATLSNQGKFYEAESLFREVVSGMEKVLGPQHAETLISKSNLATTLRVQG